MRKLTLLCLSPLVLANIAFAGGMNTPSYGHGGHAASAPRLFNGFTVTGALGGLAGQLETNQLLLSSLDITIDDEGLMAHQNLVEDTISAVSSESNHWKLFETSMAGYLELDYGFQFHSGFWLGVGVSAGFDNLKFKNTELTEYELGQMEPPISVFSGHESTLEVKLKNDFAVLFKPGFVVRHNTLIYGLVGPRWGNIKTTLNTFDGQEGEAACEDCVWAFELNGENSSSDYKIGITAGAGIKQMVSEKVSIGLEYAYTHYGNLDSTSVSYARHFTFDVDAEDSTIKPSGTDSYDDISLATNSVMATLTYRF